MSEPKLLSTPAQRARNAAFRVACARASLPAGFRMARNAGVVAGSGMITMIGQITGALLDEQEALRHGQWRYEAMLGKRFALKTDDGIGVNGPACAICFDQPLGDPALPCGHAFGCEDCSAVMIGHECPICRAPITAVGPPPPGTTVYTQGADVPPPGHWILFRAPSAGSKRSAAWRNGLRDDIVLLRTKAELAAVFAEAVDEIDGMSTLIEYAAHAPALFWSAAIFLQQAGDTPTKALDETMLALFREFRGPVEKTAKRAKK